MSNARFFRTAFTCMFTVLAGISISSAAASDKDLVWEIIDASGMIEAMEVGASDGLKAAIPPIAQQLEPLGDCGVPVIEALEADIAALLATLTDKVLLEPTVQLYAENFSVDELRAILEFYKSPVGVKIKELAPEFATAGTEGSTKALMDVMPSFQTRIQETIVKEGVKEGIVCLPVHDAVAVPSDHIGWACEEMRFQWDKQMEVSGLARVTTDIPA